MRKVVYLGLDAHVRSCVLAGMDSRGKLLFNERFSTSESALKSQLVAVKAHKKILALEESPLAGWLSGALQCYVDELIVCDPRQNKLISSNAHKSDLEDAADLCRLLRLDALKPVYHAEYEHRAIFKSAVQHYLDLRDRQRELKVHIKAKYRHAGVLRVEGQSVFGTKHRERFLSQLPHETQREIMLRLYTVLDVTIKAQQAAHDGMLQLGTRYCEIKQFMKMPGMGPINAHIFDAFIQTPHRFATKQKLWRYCRLGIVDRSSAGKPLAYKRLDRAGVGELKAVSYRAFHAAVRMTRSNEVARFFEASLHHTNHNETRARLNTQRKILAVLWTLWRKNVDYNPKLFCLSTPTAAV